MADEISAALSISISSNGETAAGNVQFTEDFSGAMIGNQQLVGTSAEALLFGDVGTPVVVFLKNQDETNYVEIDSVNTFDKFPQKLMPGQGCLLKPETGTIYAKAHTAACYVWVVAG